MYIYICYIYIMYSMYILYISNTYMYLYNITCIYIYTYIYIYIYVFNSFAPQVRRITYNSAIGISVAIHSRPSVLPLQNQNMT